MQYLKIFSLFLIITLIITGCQRKIIRLEINQIKDGKYDSEFPMVPVSEYLEEITESVKLISILVFYEGYDFKREKEVTTDDLTSDYIEQTATKRYTFDRPSTGSASIIFHKNNRVALMTCAHVVDFPDTVITYFRDSFGIETKYIKSIAFKVRQTNNIIDFPQLLNFEILIMDSKLDVAIIGKELEYKPSITSIVKPSVPVLKYPLGSAEDLNWGSFVYLIGYPRAKKMISTAIVSSPNYDKENSFLIDASLQRGMSGGLVLAIRDGIPNFEIVGMTNAVSAETQYFLQPEKDFEISEWDIHQPYSGSIYANVHKTIYYGITYAISIDKIKKFMRNNKNVLIAKGYDIESFF